MIRKWSIRGFISFFRFSVPALQGFSEERNNRAREKNGDIEWRKKEREKALREGSGVGNPPQSEQTARFGCTVTVLFNTRRDTKETDIKMEKSTRHASNERAGDRLDIVFPLLKFATTTYGGRSKSCGAPCTMMDTQTFRSTTTHGLLFFFRISLFTPLFISDR